MAGGDSPETVQRDQCCSISFRQLNVEITIRNVTTHWDILDDLDGVAMPDIFQQPPLNHSPVHSLFTENARPKQGMPPEAAIFDYMDGTDDFDLVDWAPRSVVQPPQSPDPLQQSLLAHTSERSHSTTISECSKPVIVTTGVDFDCVNDFVDLDTYDWTPVCDVQRHRNPDILKQPPGSDYGYMYNSLEDVDLDDLWPKKNLHLQQASANVRLAHTNLPLVSIPEPASERVSVHMNKPEGLQLLPGTTESLLYQQQSPYNYPYQVVRPASNPQAANVTLRQIGQPLPQKRIPQELVNPRLSSQWYGPSQLSKASPINLNINLHGKSVNIPHPNDMQARDVRTRGQQVQFYSASASSIYNQPMMGNLVAGVSTAAPHKGEVVILEENQPVKIKKSEGPLATGEKITAVPNLLHQPMLVNALPHISMSAVNVRPTFTHLPAGSDSQPVTGSITRHMYRPEGIHLLHQAPGSVVYLQQTPIIPATYRQPFHVVRPGNHPKIANMKIIQLGEQLPQGWMPLQMVNHCASTPWYGLGPSQLTKACPTNSNITLHEQPLPKDSRQILNKPHPEKRQAEDTRMQGQRDTLYNPSSSSIPNQHRMGKLVSGASTVVDHPDTPKGKVKIMEENQSTKKQKSGVLASADRNVIGIPHPPYRSMLVNAPTYSAKSAVNVTSTVMNTTSISGIQPLTRSVSSHIYRPEVMGPLQGTTGSVLNIQHIAGMPSNYKQPYQMVGSGSHPHDSKMKGRQLGDQLPQGWMPLQTINPCVSTPCYGPGPSQLTKASTANLNINLHGQPLPTNNRQMLNTPHPEKMQAKDTCTQRQHATVKSTSASTISSQQKMGKLASEVSTAASHRAPGKGEVVISEGSQSRSSQKSGAPVAADRNKTGAPPLQNPGGITSSPSTATQTRQKKECSTQHGDMPYSVGPKDEVTCTVQPIKRTNNLFGAKAQLNMRMRESVAILHKLGDKGEGSIVKHTSEVVPGRVLGKSVYTAKAKQSTHKRKLYGEGARSGHSNHTGKSTTKRKNSDNMSPTAKKAKNQISVPNKSLQKTECVTLGHEMPRVDVQPVNKPKEVQNPTKDKKGKKQCKKARQDSFKHPRSQLTMHMLESVEVFHKLGGKSEGPKTAQVQRKPAIPMFTKGSRNMSKVCKKPLLIAQKEPIPFKKPKMTSIQGNKRIINPRLIVHRPGVHKDPAAALKLKGADSRKGGTNTQTHTAI